jgi:heat shock protein HslJ
MERKSIVIIIVLLALITGILLFRQGGGVAPLPQGGTSDPKNASYVIDGSRVTLVNGVAEIEAAPGSASKIVTRYFGNEAKVDFDKDGREDTVFLLTQETGGTGTFFYVVAALNKESGAVGSSALFIGDRIAPQSTQVSSDGSVTVNYAERAQGEDFSVPPSIGKSLKLRFDSETEEFGEVVQGFEGEADPSRMTLGMKKWVWVSTLMNDGTTVTPKQKEAFTATFGPDGTISLTTDCNGAGGTYAVEGNRITFGPFASTLMFCDGSQEGEFLRSVSDSTSYHFTSKGELILDIKFDSGTVLFR